MKKISWFCLISFLCISLILVSCSSKKNLKGDDIVYKGEESPEIDMVLVNQLVGMWVGDVSALYPAYGRKQ